MAGGDQGSAHPSPTELDRFLMGELSTRQAAPVVAHLLTGCVCCRQQMAPLVALVLSPHVEPPEIPADQRAEYDFPLFRAFASARRYAAKLEQERAGAVRKPILAAVPPPPPLNALRRTARDWDRCERVLECCRSLRHSDPEGMLMLASFGVSLSNQIEPRGCTVAELADLQARAAAELGNARRVIGDVTAAEADLTRALGLAAQGTGDRSLLLHLMDLAASLYIDQRCFSKAFQLLDTAYQMHQAAGDLHAAGRTLVSKGIAAGHALDPEEAIRLLGEALRLIDARRDPKLVLATVHNLFSFLVEAGRIEEAGRLLAQSRDLYTAFAERLDRLKARWLEGFIATKLDDDATAEKAFSEVRTGFAEAELPYDAALVSLDLAAIWLRTGRTREIKGLVDEMVAIFRARNIRREAIGALLMLRQACEREGATIALLRTVTTELQRLEREPVRRSRRDER